MVGSVALTVHRRDGRPAVRAWVQVGGFPGRTDLRGRAVLREAQGATVRVRVVDEEGEGLPFAILELRPGGVQTVTLTLPSRPEPR